jgi:hypothetical protein
MRSTRVSGATEETCEQVEGLWGEKGMALFCVTAQHSVVTVTQRTSARRL